MNENIDLTKILKDCPEGTKFYTPIWGEVTFGYMYQDQYPNDEFYSFTIDNGRNMISLSKKDVILIKMMQNVLSSHLKTKEIGTNSLHLGTRRSLTLRH